MKKALTILMVISMLAAGTGLIFKDKIVDAYEDYNAAKMVEACFFLNRDGQTIGGLIIAGYNAKDNMFSIEGLVMGFFPIQADVPREAVKQAINTGDMVQVSCDTGDAQ